MAIAWIGALAVIGARGLTTLAGWLDSKEGMIPSRRPRTQSRFIDKSHCTCGSANGNAAYLLREAFRCEINDGSRSGTACNNRHSPALAICRVTP